MTAFRSRLLVVALLPLLLAGCGGQTVQESIPSLDDELVEGSNAQDPLLAAAVQDPIMTDPQLASRSNADAIRPPSQPYAAPVPATDIAAGSKDNDGDLLTVPSATKGACRQCVLARDAITLGALATRQSDPRIRRCAASLRYAAGWANRLPADLPLYGGARVIEAAGADSSTCRVRAVTFATPQPVHNMLDWLYTRASRAGYATEHQADEASQVLAGSRSRDGAAYVAFVREAAGGGSEIDLLVNSGR